MINANCVPDPFGLHDSNDDDNSSSGSEGEDDLFSINETGSVSSGNQATSSSSDISTFPVFSHRL